MLLGEKLSLIKQKKNTHLNISNGVKIAQTVNVEFIVRSTLSPILQYLASTLPKKIVKNNSFILSSTLSKSVYLFEKYFN